MAGGHPGLARALPFLPRHFLRGQRGHGTSEKLFRFQEIEQDPNGQIRKLLKELRLELDSGRLHCIEKHSEGKFHRAKHEEKDPFSADLHDLLDKTIMEADSFLRRKIGRGLPLDKYEYHRKQVKQHR